MSVYPKILHALGEDTCIDGKESDNHSMRRASGTTEKRLEFEGQPMAREKKKMRYHIETQTIERCIAVWPVVSTRWCKCVCVCILVICLHWLKTRQLKPVTHSMRPWLLGSIGGNTPECKEPPGTIAESND